MLHCLRTIYYMAEEPLHRVRHLLPWELGVINMDHSPQAEDLIYVEIIVLKLLCARNSPVYVMWELRIIAPQLNPELMLYVDVIILSKEKVLHPIQVACMDK